MYMVLYTHMKKGSFVVHFYAPAGTDPVLKLHTVYECGIMYVVHTCMHPPYLNRWTYM